MKLGKPLIALLCIGALGGAYVAMPENGNGKLKRAFERLGDGDLAGADLMLSSGGNAPSTLLYRGYLKQLRGQYEEAELMFQKASRLTADETSAVECLLAQASNAYLKGQDFEISPLIERARHLADHSHLPFYDGLTHYLSGHFGLARDHWLAFEPLGRSEEWFASVFQRLFTPGWLQIHLAHCLTEEGNYNGARERLERQLHLLGADEEPLHTLATRLLGLTYLKEAEGLPVSEKGSYYKLARFYLEHGSCSPQYYREHAAVVAALQKTAAQLLTTPELLDWGIAFVQTLQDWKQPQALETVAQQFAEQLARSPRPELCGKMRQTFQGTAFLGHVTESMMGSLQSTLKAGEVTDLETLWQAVSALSSSPATLQSRVAEMVGEEIFHTILRDDSKLSRTMTYVNFWQQLQRDPGRQTRFARGLLHQGELLWQNEGQEKKGKRLMELALSLTEEPERKQLKKEMEHFLVALYKKAESCNMVDRMMQLHDTLIYFNIAVGDLTTPSRLANTLADADYLFKSHNYHSAKTHAQWILRLDPENQDALRLYGLTSYHLGNYKQAVAALGRLSMADDYASKALILSKVHVDQGQEHHLVQIDMIESFDEDE